MPKVPIQKCASASFFEKSVVPQIRGTNQYNMPAAMKPFQPSTPACTCPMIQSV